MIKKLVTITAFVMLFAFLSTSITFNVVSASEVSACSGLGVFSCSDDEFEKFRETSFANRLRLCRSRSEIAGFLMKNRQDDGLMSDEINFWLEGNSRVESTLLDIRLAWEEPLWETVEDKQRAVNSFKNKIYTECFDAWLIDGA